MESYFIAVSRLNANEREQYRGFGSLSLDLSLDCGRLLEVFKVSACTLIGTLRSNDATATRTSIKK